MSVTYGCISCAETDNVFNIHDTHECEGVEEVYASMLKICFDITISENSPLNYMCENCILNLRQAYYFKQNVVRNLEALNTALALHIEDDIPNNSDTRIQIEEGLDPKTGEITLVVSEKAEPDENVDIQNKEFVIIGNIEVNDEISNEYIKDEDFVTTSSIDGDDAEEIKNVLDQAEEQLTEDTHFECGDCGKKFPTKIAIARHVKTHLLGSFPCHMCEKVFTKENTRSCHQWRVHRSRDPYPCALCGLRFPTYLQRLRHLQAEHGQREEYPCPHCDNVYSYAGARSAHIRETHLHVRRHNCTECKMAFFKRRDLLSHLASIHGIGEKKHNCPLCEKSFYRCSILKNHMKLHMENKKEKLKDKKHECPICQAQFMYKTVLKNHLKCHELESQQTTFYVIRKSVPVE